MGTTGKLLGSSCGPGSDSSWCTGHSFGTGSGFGMGAGFGTGAALAAGRHLPYQRSQPCAPSSCVPRQILAHSHEAHFWPLRSAPLLTSFWQAVWKRGKQKKKGTELCKTRLSRPSITPPRGCRRALLSGGAGSLPQGPLCCRAGCRLPTVQTVIRTRGDHSSRAPGAAAGKGLCVYRARRTGLPARALHTALFALGFFIRGV